MQTKIISLAAVCAAALTLAGAAVSAAETAPLRLALKAEKLTAPAGGPLPMFETLELLPRGEGRYDVRLIPGEGAPSLDKADLRLFETVVNHAAMIEATSQSLIPIYPASGFGVMSDCVIRSDSRISSNPIARNAGEAFADFLRTTEISD